MRGALSILAILTVAGGFSACAGPQCGSTQGFVYGTVTGGLEPVKVVAMKDGSVAAEATVQSDGSYELNLNSLDDGMEFDLHAEDSGGCAAGTITETVKSCEEYELDFSVPDCQ